MKKFLEEKQREGTLFFDIAEAMEKTGNSRANVIASLAFYKKKGEIISPFRGIYVIVPLGDQVRGSLEPSELIAIAMRAKGIPYYLGLLSAAVYHGASHQPPQKSQVFISKRKKKPWQFGRVGVEFLYKKDLDKVYTEERVVDNGILKISTPEQTAKDIMIFSKQSGGLNHIATIIHELFEAIDEEKMVSVMMADKKKNMDTKTRIYNRLSRF